MVGLLATLANPPYAFSVIPAKARIYFFELGLPRRVGSFAKQKIPPSDASCLLKKQIL